MPQGTLSRHRVEGLLARPLDDDEIETLLFRSKAELASRAGDDLQLEVTADRLDLLDEGGLAQYFAGARGEAWGIPDRPTAELPTGARFEVGPGVAPLRPVLAGIIVEAPAGVALDAGLLAEAVRFQELVHATVGRDRRLASLGLYPLERIRWPIRYDREPVESVRFVPLDSGSEVDAAAFFSTHPLAEKYGALGRTADGCLTLRDADRRVLSLPPVLNAAGTGEARVGDRRLLIESTGTLEGRVGDALGLLLLPFAARGWRSVGVPVQKPGGRHEPPPHLGARSLSLQAETIRSIAGEEIAPKEVEEALGRSRLTPHGGPDAWTVEVPPWRPDLLGEVDLVEDLLLARGLRADSGILPPARTRGRRLPEARFRARVQEILLGLGFTPLLTTVLVPGRLVRRLGRDRSIEVANPVSEQYSHLRDRLLVSLMGALERNVRHGYPQRLSEVGAIVERDPSAEAGGATRSHAAVLIAAEGAGFADVAAIVDYLLGALGTAGVREPAEIPGTILGRAARVRLAGETVAEVAEVAPDLLTDLSVPVPVAWAEVDLGRLAPLLARAQTP